MMKIICNIILIFNFITHSQLLAQLLWHKLETDKEYYIDALTISNKKEIFASIYGKNIIYRSIDGGNTWDNILLSNEKYYPQIKKQLFIDHQDSLILFYSYDGFLYPRKWDGLQTFRIIDSVRPEIVNQLLPKFNLKGEYFDFSDNRFYKFTKLWSKKIEFLKFDDQIVDFYLYSDSSNFIVTMTPWNELRFNIFSSIAGNFHHFGNYRNDLAEYTNTKEKLFINDSAHIFLGNNLGFYISRDSAKSWKNIQFTNSSLPNEEVIFVYFSKHNSNIFVKTLTNLYLSTNRGYDWILLDQLNRNIDSNATKPIIIDTSTAFLQFSGSCLGTGYVKQYSRDSFKWGNIDFGRSYPNINVTQANSITFYGIPDYRCNVFITKDNCKTWKELMVFGNRIKDIKKVSSNIHFLIDEKNNIFISDSSFTNFNKILLDISFIEIGGICFCSDKFINLYVVIDYTSKGIPIYYHYYSKLPEINFKYIQTLEGDISERVNCGLCNSKGQVYNFEFGKNRVLFSKDEGNTWEQNQLFKEFSRIYFVDISQNDFILLSGAHKTLGLNLYILDSLNNFNPLSNYWLDKFAIINAKNYPFLIAAESTKGVGISYNGGINWLKYDYGLPTPQPPDNYILYNLPILKDDNSFFLPVVYDGFYETILPLPISTKNLTKKSEPISVQNPVQDELIVFIIDSINCNFLLTNVNGKNMKAIAKKEQGYYVIDTSNLIPGIYFISINIDGRIYSSKFVKV